MQSKRHKRARTACYQWYKIQKKKKKERQNFSERKISGCWGQGQSRGWMQENHFKKVGETFLGDGNIQWYDCGGDYTAI